MFQQNISTDNSIYYNHFKKRSIGRGEGWVEVPFIPSGLECNRLRGYWTSSWNLSATVSDGKDKNFPE